MCLCAIPAAAQQAPPAPPTQAAPSVGDTGTDTAPVSFEYGPKQVELGTRLIIVSGDPARVLRFSAFRDGLLFTSLRFGREEENAHDVTSRDVQLVESTAEYVLRFGARRAPSSCDGPISAGYHTVVRR